MVDETAPTSVVVTEATEANDESSDDDDLFDNLRTLRDKYREVSVDNSAAKSTAGRKRSRSTDQEDDSREQKVPKVVQADQMTNDSDDDDILSFAKRTLQIDEPETEDILGNIPKPSMGKF